MTGPGSPTFDDHGADGTLRKTVNDAIATVQELRAVAYLIDNVDVFGDPPPGARGRAHRSGVLLVALLERELGALEMLLLAIDMMVG